MLVRWQTSGHLVSSCTYFWVRWPLGVILYILLGSMATGCHLVRGYRDCHTCRSKYLTPLQPSSALFHNQLSPLPLACILATSVPFGHSVCVPPPLTLFFFSSSSFFFFCFLKKNKTGSTLSLESSLFKKQPSTKRSSKFWKLISSARRTSQSRVLS